MFHQVFNLFHLLKSIFSFFFSEELSVNSVVTDSSSRVTKRTVCQKFYSKLQYCLLHSSYSHNDQERVSGTRSFI